MVKLLSRSARKENKAVKEQAKAEKNSTTARNTTNTINKSNVVTSSELSHIGKAAIKELETNHSQYHEKLWARTSGAVIGNVLSHSPRGTWNAQSDPEDGHSDWLPRDWLRLSYGAILSVFLLQMVFFWKRLKRLCKASMLDQRKWTRRS